MKFRPFIFLFVLTLIVLFMSALANELLGQCPMCRMAAESNLANGGSEGKGLNKGILYMLSVPYLFVATLGFVWWKNNKNTADDAEDKLP